MMKKRYYCTVKPYNENTDMVHFFEFDQNNSRNKSVEEYEADTGYKPLTLAAIKKIISKRVVRGIRGYVYDELRCKGSSVVFVRAI